MNPNKILTEKYQSVREQVAGAGEQMSGGDTPQEEFNVEVIPVAISWKDIGLFEPENEEDTKECEKAIKEVEKLFDTFEKDLDKWQKKYKNLGALDTVASEQIAQFIAKNLLGLKKLD